MTLTVGGPMFEPAESGPWKSTHKKQGAHYNHFECRDADGMAALRQFFPDGHANDKNFVLFSTSGVHGTYHLIEDAWADLTRGNKDEDGNDVTPHVTFLIVQPRICCLRYGNCQPQTAEDFVFLKALRESSRNAMREIGWPS